MVVVAEDIPVCRHPIWDGNRTVAALDELEDLAVGSSNVPALLMRDSREQVL
jgi:hypothetical protein